MPNKKESLSFEEAREHARALEFKSYGEWAIYCKSGQRPSYVPAAPRRVYKGEWRGWGDWLGTGNVSTRNREYLSFEEARNHIRGQGLKNNDEWTTYCTSGQKPGDIPSRPDRVYKNEWQDWGDWMGTGNIHAKAWRPFLEAREYVRALKLKGQREWRAYCKSGQKPEDIPSGPHLVYKDEWQGDGDWLGTGTIASFNMTYRPFEEARAYVRRQGLKSRREWDAYCKSGQKPDEKIFVCTLVSLTRVRST